MGLTKLKIKHITLFESGHAMLTHKGDVEENQYVDLFAPMSEAIDLLINTVKVKIIDSSDRESYSINIENKERESSWDKKYSFN